MKGTTQKVKKVSARNVVIGKPKKAAAVQAEAPVGTTVEVPVEAPVEVSVVDEKSSSDEEQKSSKKTNKKEAVEREVEALHALVSEFDEIFQSMRKNKEIKMPAFSKFMTDVKKKTNKLVTLSLKLNKKKTTTGSSDSGFKRPVNISPAIAQFTGWDVNQPVPRVAVTNFICAYIKDNNLQNPNNKKIILPDDKLAAVLDYSVERDGDLTYASIQKFLSKHYIKIPTVKVEA